MPTQSTQSRPRTETQTRSHASRAETRIGRLQLSRVADGISGYWVRVESGESYYTTGVSRQNGREIYYRSAVRSADGRVRGAESGAPRIPLPSQAELERDLAPLLGLRDAGHSGGLVPRYRRQGYPGSYTLQEHFLIYLLDLQATSTAGVFTRPGFHPNAQQRGHRAEYRLQTSSGEHQVPQVRFNGGRTAQGHLLPPQTFTFCRWEFDRAHNFAQAPRPRVAPTTPRNTQPQTSSPLRNQEEPETPRSPAAGGILIAPPIPRPAPANNEHAPRPRASNREASRRERHAALLRGAVGEIQRRLDSASSQGQLVAVQMTPSDTRVSTSGGQSRSIPTNEIGAGIFEALTERRPSEPNTSEPISLPPTRIVLPATGDIPERRYIVFFRNRPVENQSGTTRCFVSPDDQRLPDAVRMILNQHFINPFDTWRSLRLTEQQANELGIPYQRSFGHEPQYRYRVFTTGDIEIDVRRADEQGRYGRFSSSFGCSVPRMFQFFNTQSSNPIPLFVPSRVRDGRYTVEEPRPRL